MMMMWIPILRKLVPLVKKAMSRARQVGSERHEDDDKAQILFENSLRRLRREVVRALDNGDLEFKWGTGRTF